MVHNLDSSDTNMALVPKIKGRISCIKPWASKSGGSAGLDSFYIKTAVCPWLLTFELTVYLW